MESMWYQPADTPTPGDTYRAFRGRFALETDTEVEIRLVGATIYEAWLDGAWLLEGPARYHPAHPEYDVRRVALAAGEHVLAVLVHYVGHATEVYPHIEPFLWAEVRAGERPLDVRWCHGPGVVNERRARALRGEQSWVGVFHHGPWEPAGDWRAVQCEDADWPEPCTVQREVGPPVASTIGPVQRFVHELTPTAQGVFVESIGMGPHDDLSVTFFTRDLAPGDGAAPAGRWLRFDLGRVRLGRVRLDLELPHPARVDVAMCEHLVHGRVHPWINFCHGPSCNMDVLHTTAPGRHRLEPLTPKGGRYLEVHISSPPEAAEVHEATFLERGYHGEPEGAFSCSDAQLGRIWQVGVETLRACAEDSIIDNPTRERGHWTGDVVSVAMDIVAAAWSDMRLLRRALVQEAQCARADGIVPALCPGVTHYMSTYAIQWVSACMRYHQLTGDESLLHELFPAAKANMDGVAYAVLADPAEKERNPDYQDINGFIDWGYVGDDDGAHNTADLMHLLVAARDMLCWCGIVGEDAVWSKTAELVEQCACILRRWLEARMDEPEGWRRIGYHRAVLALRAGLLRGEHARQAIDFIKSHMLGCFPNQPDAPRLDHYLKANPRLITPYFAHFAMPVLIEHGEMDFVLDQYRRCWGWALDDGRTTWVEVFDTHWSHCHQWSGCPTWQLSRYVLGLWPRFDLGPDHYILDLQPGSLEYARGRLPTRTAGETIGVAWRREGDRIVCQIDTARSIAIHIGGSEAPAALVAGTFDLALPQGAEA